MSATPIPPPNYILRDIEQEVISSLLAGNGTFVRPIVSICNEKVDQGPTGKTALAAFICTRDIVRDHFCDGVLFFSLSAWVASHSHLEEFFSSLLKEMVQLLSPKILPSEYRERKYQTKQSWQRKIYDLMSLTGAECRILLVLDDLSDHALLTYLAPLGLAVLVTTRCTHMECDKEMWLSQLLPSGESMFCRSVVDPAHYAELSNGPSLGALISCACRIGGGQTRMTGASHDPCLGEMLLKNMYGLSVECRRALLGLSVLPAGVFVPARLVQLVWESILQHHSVVAPHRPEEHRDSLDEETALRWNDFSVRLVSMSLLVMSTTGDSVMVPAELSHMLTLLIPDGSTVQSDAESLLAYVLHDRELIISLDFENHIGALLLCFESVGWSCMDIMNHYSILFEDELQRMKQPCRGRKMQFRMHEQLEILFGLERLLNCLFLAFTGCGVEHLVRDSLGSSDSRLAMITWAHSWMTLLVESLYELYYGELPLELVPSLEFYARLSEACGFMETAVRSRREIVDIQRTNAGVDDETTATALYVFASVMFTATGAGGLDPIKISDEGERDPVEVMETACRMSIHAFTGHQHRADSALRVDRALLLLCDILSLRTATSSARVVCIIKDVLNKRKLYHRTVYHPRVAESYQILATALHAAGKSAEALQMMNKSARIVKTLFGSRNHVFADSMEVMANLLLSVGDRRRAEQVQRKVVSTRIALKEQAEEKDALSGSLLRLDAILNSAQTAPSSAGELFDYSSSRGRRKIEGTVDDAALLVALADKLNYSGQYVKSRKYTSKSLQIIKKKREACSNDAGSEKLLASLDIIRWSAFSKLGETCELEGQSAKALTLYQKALKGFLSGRHDSAEYHRAESVTIAYNIASLVASTYGFGSAVDLYIQVVNITYDLACDRSIVCLPLFDSPVSAWLAMLEEIAVLFENNIQDSVSNFNKCEFTILYSSERSSNDMFVLLSDKDVLQFVERLRYMAADLVENAHQQGVYALPLHRSTEYTEFHTSLREILDVDNIPGDQNRGGNSGSDSYNDDDEGVAGEQPGSVFDEFTLSHDESWSERAVNGHSPREIGYEESDSFLMYPHNSTLLPLDIRDLNEEEVLDERSEAMEAHIASAEMGKRESAVGATVMGNSDEIQKVEHFVVSEEAHCSEGGKSEAVPDMGVGDSAESTAGSVALNEASDVCDRRDTEDETVISLFVYGSLRRHQHNHRLLHDRSLSYMGTTVTLNTYFMYVDKLTGGAVVTADPLKAVYRPAKSVVVGEIYSVHRRSLKDFEHILPTKCALCPIDVMDIDGGQQRDRPQGGVFAFVLESGEDSETERGGDMVNVPRGNYSQFISARGGIDAFLKATFRRTIRKASTGDGVSSLYTGRPLTVNTVY